MRIYVIIIIAVLALLTTICRSAKFKGFQGEQQVRRILSRLPEDRYIVLNDVMLKTPRGSTQIDHVVVSIYGIFVIETKNYTGWITGSERGEMWTKTVYKKKYEFYNPIRQNYAHIKALSEKLSIDMNYFIPIVAFSDKCSLKVYFPHLVIYFKKLSAEINMFKDEKIKPEDMHQIAGRINDLNRVSQDMRSSHVETIKENI